MITPEKALQIFRHEIYASGAEKAEMNRVIDEALGKQIAKGLSKSSSEKVWGACSSCGRIYWETYLEDYCGTCGQKLREDDEK